MPIILFAKTFIHVVFQKNWLLSISDSQFQFLQQQRPASASTLLHPYARLCHLLCFKRMAGTRPGFLGPNVHVHAFPDDYFNLLNIVSNLYFIPVFVVKQGLRHWLDFKEFYQGLLPDQFARIPHGYHKRIDRIRYSLPS